MTYWHSVAHRLVIVSILELGQNGLNAERITDGEELIPGVFVSAPVGRIERPVKSIGDNETQRRVQHLMHRIDELTGASRYDRLQTTEPRLEQKRSRHCDKNKQTRRTSCAADSGVHACALVICCMAKWRSQRRVRTGLNVFERGRPSSTAFECSRTRH